MTFEQWYDRTESGPIDDIIQEAKANGDILPYLDLRSGR